MRNTSVIVLLFVFFASIYATNHGVDVSTLTLTTSFSCLKATSPGYYYAIVRAWKSSGSFDTSCPQTVANAWAAGLNNVDVYMFPCFNCGNPQAQVQQAVANLTNTNTVFNTFWLDVESTDLWSTNLTANQVFFQGLVDAGEALGLNIGVYASKTMWTGIMGSWNGAKDYPLWYPRYNNLTNYDDFSTFGGWTTPVMKQYLGTTSICGASVDFNWYPPSPSPTPTPTTSPTPSVTPSRTPSRTPSPSASPSSSPSPTKSPTPSRTPSRSPSRTPSPSRSATPSASVSSSVTPTPSTSAIPSLDPDRSFDMCSQCFSDSDCSNGQGICVSSSSGSYCSCLSGFGGCDCSEQPNPVCSSSYSEIDTLGGNFQASAEVDYEYPNLFVTVEANLEESSWNSENSNPPYSLETLVYFGNSPDAFPECSYPNGQGTWKDFAADESCTDVLFANMTWEFAKSNCGFVAAAGTKQYSQSVTILRRYNLNGAITRTEQTTRHLNINFPQEVIVVDSNVTVNFPAANAFAGISSVDYNPDSALWEITVQTSVNKPYSLGDSVSSIFSGNLGIRAPTVSISGCTSVGSACVQTITYTYPQGGASDPCVGLLGTDLHTFAVQCSTPSCPGPNLLNISLTLNTGNACPIQDDIDFSEASLHTYTSSSLSTQKTSFSVTDVLYFGASVQSTEAMISSRSLKANSVCFQPPEGACFYANYTVLSSTNGKEPVFKVDLTSPGNSDYFGSLTSPTTFSVKATVAVDFVGAKSAKSRTRKSLPQTQTVDTIVTAVIGAQKMVSSSTQTAPVMMILILAAMLVHQF